MTLIYDGMDTDKVERDITKAYIIKLTDRISELESKLAGAKYTVDLFCVKYKELEKELEEAMTFNVDVVRCLSRIASVENHNEVPAYIDMSRRCIKTIEAKQAKALKEGKQ
jgi:hypothetical protein